MVFRKWDVPAIWSHTHTETQASLLTVILSFPKVVLFQAAVTFIIQNPSALEVHVTLMHLLMSQEHWTPSEGPNPY